MLYRITSYREGEDGPVRKDTRKRSDAAETVLWSHMFGALEDQGLNGSPAQGPALKAFYALDVTRGGTMRVGSRMIVVTASKGGA